MPVQNIHITHNLHKDTLIHFNNHHKKNEKYAFDEC